MSVMMIYATAFTFSALTIWYARQVCERRKSDEGRQRQTCHSNVWSLLFEWARAPRAFMSVPRRVETTMQEQRSIALDQRKKQNVSFFSHHPHKELRACGFPSFRTRYQHTIRRSRRKRCANGNFDCSNRKSVTFGVRAFTERTAKRSQSSLKPAEP